MQQGHTDEKASSQARGRACGEEGRDAGSTSGAELSGLGMAWSTWRKAKRRGLRSWAGDTTVDGEKEMDV